MINPRRPLVPIVSEDTSTEVRSKESLDYLDSGMLDLRFYWDSSSAQGSMQFNVRSTRDFRDHETCETPERRGLELGVNTWWFRVFG